MKPFLPSAKDITTAQELLSAAAAGNIAEVRALYESGAACGLWRQDVQPEADAQALGADSAGADSIFTMLNLHEMGKALNAALYFAAFNGHADVVEYFIAQDAYCQDSLNVALLGAAARGRAGIVTDLLAAGADAACGDGACVAASIARGNSAITDTLLKAGKAYTAALSAYIDHENTDKVIDMLAEGAEPLAGLQAACRQLSDRNWSRDHAHDGNYTDAFDIIVSYATGHGDDIPQLLRAAMTYAIDQEALGAIERIATHEEFQNVSDRKTQLDAALSAVGFSAFRGFNPVRYEAYEETAEKLMSLGADAQIGLGRGVEAMSVPLVVSALSHGADPRRDNSALLKATAAAVQTAGPRSPAGRILSQLQEAAQKLDARDYDLFVQRTAGGLTVAMLRAASPEGHTGLMVAAAAGKGEDALATFRKEGVMLSASDLLVADKSGVTTLDLFCDRGQARLLVDKNLWLLRESDYAKVFEQMPDTARKELSTLHNDTLNALQSHRDTVRLKEQAEAHKKQFRLK